MEKEHRAKIKKDYKSVIQPMGIYQLKNISNGKLLVGSSRSLDKVYNRIRFQLELGNYIPNKELQQEWNEYGAEKFVFEILDELKPEEGKNPDDYINEMKTLEDIWVEKLQPYGDQGYNRRKT